MRKNLLFIFADQWRRHAVGCANADQVITPNMDSFARESVYCQNAVSSFPLCSPHRASLLSGRGLQAHGVFTNCKTGLSMRLKDEEVCIAQVLQDKGYKTGYVGKWHLDEPEINNNAAPKSGAANWDAYTPQGIRRHGFEFWHSYGACDEHLTPHYWENSEKQLKYDEWSPIHETDIALNFLKTAGKENPFCLFLSWNPPHSPYNLVPEKYLKLYENKEINFRNNVDYENIHHHTGEEAQYTKEKLLEITKQYFAAVSGLDDQFGRILAQLKEEDLLKDTIIVLSADHGDMLGSHGLMAKHVWYEESTGIPFIIGGAGINKGNCATVFGSADIAPTLLDLLNAPVPTQMEGKSIANDIINCETNKNSFTFMAACPGRDVFLKEFAAAGKNPRDYGWRAIRTFTHTYVLDAGYAPAATVKLTRLLYDNIADPYQLSPILIDSTSNNIAQKTENILIEELKKASDGFLMHL